MKGILHKQDTTNCNIKKNVLSGETAHMMIHIAIERRY